MADTATVAQPLPAAVPLTRRSRATNHPASRISGNTAEGRRVRALARAYLERLGEPTDVAIVAQVYRAAELVTLAEQAARRCALHSPSEGNLNDVIRAENLAGRALRRLKLDRPDMRT